MRALIRVYDRAKVVRKFGLDMIHKTRVPFLKWKLTIELRVSAVLPLSPTHLPMHSSAVAQYRGLGHG